MKIIIIKKKATKDLKKIGKVCEEYFKENYSFLELINSDACKLFHCLLEFCMNFYYEDKDKTLVI